jgi:hypothetical protein
VKERKKFVMSVKGDRSRVTNLTRYTKNYTKIFKNWIEDRTPVPNIIKKKSVQKTKK